LRFFLVPPGDCRKCNFSQARAPLSRSIFSNIITFLENLRINQ
jgi:hypothetical protein